MDKQQPTTKQTSKDQTSQTVTQGSIFTSLPTVPRYNSYDAPNTEKHDANNNSD